MLIEIVSVEGSEPNDEALNFFKMRLDQNNICKSSSIRVLKRSIKDPSEEPWDREKLVAFEQKNRRSWDNDPEDRHLKLFISYIPGPYEEPDYENLAGLQYSSTSFSIIRTGCNSRIESSTLLHEFGHTLDFDFESRGEPPVNKDRPSHCNNHNCVMYWKITGPRKTFGMRCRIDLGKLIRDN